MITLKRLALLNAMVAVIAALSLMVSVTTNSNQNARNCRNIEKIKDIQRKPLLAYRHALGKRGTVGYAYYRVHPDELAAVKKQITDQLGGLRPSKC